MTRSHAHGPPDALVFFGATGDLAYKQIFPALAALVARQRLDVPLIGVAKSGWGPGPAHQAGTGQPRLRAQPQVQPGDGGGNGAPGTCG
ncbi:hypothetical protein ACTWPT_54875 [Nonomuraea sp. 3N208]|uniref:hypothetical protein n=1 Tax=Nonomuraea sp. 3N208 TaxID=3457421 RepID=UPI003FCF0502